MRETSILKNKWLVITIAVLCWALSTSFIAGYYWLQYTDFINRVGGVPVTINVGVNYGNSTVAKKSIAQSHTTVWTNNTKALTGMTLLKVTEEIANITYDKRYLLVDSINNVTQTSNYDWFWWLWTGKSWMLGPVGPAAYAVSQNETFMWYYEMYQTWPPASPPQ